MSDIIEMKATAEKMMTNLQAIQESNLAIVEHQTGASDERKSLGEKFDTQQKAIDDLAARYEDMEKAQARKSEVATMDQKELSDVHKNIEHYNMIQASMGRKEVTYDEAKAIGEAQKAFFRKGSLDALNSEQKTLMNTIISPDGGYIVAPEFAQTIVNKKFSMQGIMDLVNIKNIAGNTFTQPLDYADYNNSEYVNELANGVTDEHEPDYKQIVFTPTEQIYKFRISRNLSEDAMFNVETDVLSKGRAGAMRQSSAQIVVGDGADRPKGLLTYIDASNGVIAYNKIESVESNASQSVTWKDVLGILPSALIEGYSEAYAMRKATFFNSLLTDLDGASQYAIMNQINFFSGEGVALSILGAPVKFDIGMGDANVAGAYAVLYGDFKEAYTFTQRIGFSLIVDNVTSGQFITYRLRRRNDGKLVLGDALKALKVKA